MIIDHDPDFADLKYDRERINSALVKLEPIVLDRVCFAIVLPDAFIRGIEDSVIANLKENGFTLLNYSTKYLEDADVEYLYKIGFHKKIDEARKTHWRMTRKGLKAGICLGLLLYHPEGDAVQRLLKLKGASNPSDAAPDSVRGSLVSFSKILALLHSSDDIKCVIRESSMFFSEDEFLANLHDVGSGSVGADFVWDDVRMSIARTQPNDSPVLVFANLSVRILSYINHRYPSSIIAHLLSRTRRLSTIVSTDEGSWNNHAALYIEYERDVGDIYGGEQWQASMRALLEVALNNQSLVALADAQLLLILKLLATGMQSLELDVGDLCNHLRLAGIYHDEWEIKRIENFYFFRNELLGRADFSLDKS